MEPAARDASPRSCVARRAPELAAELELLDVEFGLATKQELRQALEDTLAIVDEPDDE